MGEEGQSVLSFFNIWAHKELKDKHVPPMLPFYDYPAKQ